MSTDFFARHRETLEQALRAIRTREYWSAYPEAPSGRVYGETAGADGQAAFEARLNRPFPIDQPGTVGRAGAETSPYGMALGITYPKVDPAVLLPAMRAAMPAWRDAGPDTRAGVCLEILHRLNRRSFELAHAVMHTTGQGFVMAFQAGGPHAQDRGLEALAYAYEEMKRVPEKALWTKPQGKAEPVTMEKTYHLVPRGIGLVIGCSTFPTWNSYPGLFASLATGNAVVMKPHSGAILPAAITVEVAREVLAEAGFDPDLVALAAETVGERRAAAELALRPEVKIIDFTGSSRFGDWLEENARQADVYTEKAGVNCIVIDSVADMQAVSRNLAFTLSLYSGQMCTTAQNLFIPRDGIPAGEGRLSFDEVAAAIAGGVRKFLSDPERAAEVLGAIQCEATAERTDRAAELGEMVLAPEAREHPRFPAARMRSPAILKMDAREAPIYGRELFGPIAFLVATDSTAESIERVRATVREHGAITLAVYSTDEAVLAAAEALAMDVGVALSVNLTDGIFVNQSAAFSDYHATGANPAANACLTDSAFVAKRFRVVQSRRHV
ncbi:MAG: phenylacetic acid degradation protein PaaN [Gammaproteobacteria bacterium]|nr:phenylacetic acid degradation protein PaaN [Gammaproteobacteria bacterium]